MYQLYYAPLNLEGDIEKRSFKKLIGLKGFIYTVSFMNRKGRVFLFTAKTDDIECPVFIEESATILWSYGLSALKRYKVLVLQEFPSYEAAYEVALSIRERSSICYEPEESEK